MFFSWPAWCSPTIAPIPGVFTNVICFRSFGELAYRSEAPEKASTGTGILLVTEHFRQNGKRQQIEIALASLKRVFRLGETLATVLVGLVTRIAAKIAPTPTPS